MVLRRWFRSGSLRQVTLVMGVALLCVAMLAGFLVGPIGTAVEIGSDEHYEVSKGLLWSRGYHLYGQVWNDQPPLYTALLAVSFKCCGGTVAVARALAAAFGCSLLLGMGLLVALRCGAWAGFLAAACLVMAPQVLALGVSAMLEVPAIGTALWALWPLCAWQEKRKASWLATSGIIFAAAMQIKLTAIVVFPALLIEILLGGQDLNKPRGFGHCVRAFAIWLAAFGGAYLVLAASLGTVPANVLWGAHFSSWAATPVEVPGTAPFWPTAWEGHAEGLFAAGSGLVLALGRQARRRLIFPVVWLATVTLVHLWHRPWWPYYYLHFAVPMAWLGGYGIATLFQMAWAEAESSGSPRCFRAYGFLTAGSVLSAMVMAIGGDRTASEIERIRTLPRVEDSMLVAEMRQYAKHTRLVFTEETIYPFHAGLVVIPDLAVLPAKRYWSGQITKEQIWITVKRRRPEQLLLPSGPLSPLAKEFVEAGYVLVYREDGHALYVARSLLTDGE